MRTPDQQEFVRQAKWSGTLSDMAQTSRTVMPIAWPARQPTVIETAYARATRQFYAAITICAVVTASALASLVATGTP